MDDFEILFNQWLKNESKNLSRQRLGKEDVGAKRKYIHFDKRRQASSLIDFKKIFKYSDGILKIAFWPFLKLTIKTPRIKNKKDGLRKKQNKLRNVYYAAHRDACVYSWYSFLLNQKYYEPLLKKLGLDECVIAYRKIPTQEDTKKNKCNIHFAKEVFEYIKNNQRDCVAFVSDITSFFDNLDHEHLKKEWLKVLNLDQDNELPPDHQLIYKNLTKFKYVDAEKMYHELMATKDSIKTLRRIILNSR